jgi:4'-phosphopantetheinyl transferase EntD
MAAEASRKLTDLMRPLLPGGVELCAARDTGQPVFLHPAEAHFVAMAVASRRREFALGRECARAALADLGFRDAVVPAEPDRSPRWPRGVVGSISHSGDYVAAIAASQAVFRGIGIDLERLGRISDELWTHLFDDGERGHLFSAATEERQRLATTIFSAKESFYKAQYAWRGRWLDFKDVHVEVDGTRLHVWDLTTPDQPPYLGFHVCSDELVATALCCCA